MVFQEAYVQFLEILCHVLQRVESLLFAVQMKPCVLSQMRTVIEVHLLLHIWHVPDALVSVNDGLKICIGSPVL